MKYFIHDTNAFQDEKVTRLFIHYGYEGVGLFYTVLEKLALQEKPVITSVLKKQLFIGKRLEKCWEFMEEIDLISSNNGETFNKQLLNFSEKFQIKKEKNRKRISEWRENQDATKNVTHYEHVRNTRKVKISKVNTIDKSIVVEETKENIIFKNAVEWMQENTPSILNMNEPFTEKQFTQLRSEFSNDQIKHLLLKMHNWKPLLTKNKSANLTLKEWAKRETFKDLKTEQINGKENKPEIRKPERKPETNDISKMTGEEYLMYGMKPEYR